MTAVSARQARRFPGLEGFIRPALPRSGPWRSLGATCLLAAGLLACSAASGVLAVVLTGAELRDGGRLGPLAQLCLLAGFLLTWPVLWGVMRLFHRRGPSTLLGPAPLVPAYLRGMAVMAAFALTGICIALLSIGAPQAGPGASPGMAAAVLLLLLVQTASEELVFRGYLLQQLAVRWRNPLGWALLPSVLFGLMHYTPSVPADAALMAMIRTGGLGLLLALVTARTGTLGAAMGIHFVNNVMAMLVVGSAESQLGLTLWQWPPMSFGLLDFVVMPLWLGVLGLACWKLLPVPTPQAAPARPGAPSTGTAAGHPLPPEGQAPAGAADTPVPWEEDTPAAGPCEATAHLPPAPETGRAGRRPEGGIVPDPDLPARQPGTGIATDPGPSARQPEGGIAPDPDPSTRRPEGGIADPGLPARQPEAGVTPGGKAHGLAPGGPGAAQAGAPATPEAGRADGRPAAVTPEAETPARWPAAGEERTPGG
ncbi:type II CAAX endopeptidase family protein [Paroceanicella profunda]|nr:type II CAAX endopeptidase family protein [Paroceanicella profunda]